MAAPAAPSQPPEPDAENRAKKRKHVPEYSTNPVIKKLLPQLSCAHGGLDGNQKRFALRYDDGASPYTFSKKFSVAGSRHAALEHCLAEVWHKHVMLTNESRPEWARIEAISGLEWGDMLTDVAEDGQATKYPRKGA